MSTEDDEDRAAILARRSRLIGLALSGLAVTACDDAPAPPPSPCLSAPTRAVEDEVTDDDGRPRPEDAEDPARAVPCLSPAQPPAEPVDEADPPESPE